MQSSGYKRKLFAAGFSGDLPDLIHNLFVAELVGHHSKDDGLLLGVKSKMFDFIPNVGGYPKVSDLMNEGLARMSHFHPPVLMISKKGAVSGGLHARATNAITFPLPGIILFDENNLKDNVVFYKMVNPRDLDEIPPLYIALAQESWFIPDHTAKDPVVQLTWRFRFLNNQSAGLITADDFKGAEVVVFAARPNPNYDRSPNLMFFRSPFGGVTDVEVSAGGIEFDWAETTNRDNKTIIRYSNPNGSITDYGQLVDLSVQKK